MQHISLEEFREWQRRGEAMQLVDVREADEHAAANIGGDLLPLSAIGRTPADFFDGSRPVVVYCKRGMRSQVAIQRWQQRFPGVRFYNLRDGILPLLSAIKAVSDKPVG